MRFLDRHKEGVIVKFAFLYEPRERGRTLAETGKRFFQERVALPIQPAVIDVTEGDLRRKQLLPCQKSLRIQLVEGYKIRIQAPRRRRLVGRIAEPRLAERQHLPVCRARAGEIIQKRAGTPRRTRLFRKRSAGRKRASKFRSLFS